MSADAGRLLAELDENWRAMGKGQEAGVLRACAMTLIVIVREGEDGQALGSVLAEIMHEHPNRTIVLRVGTCADPLADARGSKADAGGRSACADPLATARGSKADAGGVEARTAIQCWMPFGGRRQICCEQIEISASRESLGAVPPVLFGLMVADLPVAVWSKDLELASLNELRPVLKLAGKVMVDSAGSEDLRSAARGLRALSGGPWRLADLTWARVTRWRDMIARALEGVAVQGRATVTYAGPGEPAAARYVAAWLESSVGVEVRVACEDAMAPEPGTGRIKSVSLGGLTMRRVAPTTIRIERGAVQSTAVFPLWDDATVLREELGVFGRDEQFERALARFLEPA
ncbi:MAG: glucose-6-phosphate dehydrogenase assembly protein OpcA [Candidatus Solibacter usitatus]|nr:glucose-6-phosphate dehydrogenase assembly protein OpcA [Candidatus Solibacter usitatus]